MIGLLVSTAFAQEADFDSRYAEMVEQEVSSLSVTYAAIIDSLLTSDEGKAEYRRVLGDTLADQPGLRVTAVDGAGNTVSDRLGLAIATTGDEDGVIAGLTVAPVALLFRDSGPFLRGLDVTVRNLEGGGTRLGSAWALNLTTLKDAPSTVGIALNPFDEGKARADLAELKADLQQVCQSLVPPQSPPNSTSWDTARSACGFGAMDELGMAARLIAVRRVVDEEAKRLASSADETSTEWKRAYEALEDELQRLDGYRPGGPAALPTEKEMRIAYHRVAWDALRVRLAPSISGDFEPRQWGFNPDTSNELPSGRLTTWTAAGTVSVWMKRFEFTATGGLTTQPSLDDGEPKQSVPFGGSVTAVLCTLNGDPLRGPQRKLNVNEDGTLPPRLAMGAALNNAFSLSPPETQVSPWASQSYGIYLDVHATKDIGFRIGSQIKGELVTREATDEEPSESDLQWTAPISLVTVLKL